MIMHSFKALIVTLLMLSPINVAQDLLKLGLFCIKMLHIWSYAAAVFHGTYSESPQTPASGIF